MRDALLRVLLRLLVAGVDSKMLHIQIVRDLTPLDLKAAKDFVDEAYRELHATCSCAGCGKLSLALEDVGGAHVCYPCAMKVRQLAAELVD